MVVGGVPSRFQSPTTSARMAEWGQEDRAELGGTRSYEEPRLGVHPASTGLDGWPWLKLAGRNLATLPLIHELPWGDALVADGR